MIKGTLQTIMMDMNYDGGDLLGEEVADLMNSWEPRTENNNKIIAITIKKMRSF